jgi:SAM-dependent methyltransferase
LRLKVPTVSNVRWGKAQSAEARFWEGIESRGLLRICASLSEFLRAIGAARTSSLFDDKEVLEIGCGPLGISIASLYHGKERVRRLVKADPLPQLLLKDTAAASDKWARPLVDWVEQLSREGEYIRRAGEELRFDGEFDTVIVYNVIDHVRDPLRVLQTGHSALRNGGTILLAVDCFSVLGRLRFDHYIRRAYKGSILVDAHPHSFTPKRAAALVEAAGFRNVECLSPRSRVQDLLGHSYFASFVAKKI